MCLDQCYVNELTSPGSHIPPRCTSRVPFFALDDPPGPNCAESSAISFGMILLRVHVKDKVQRVVDDVQRSKISENVLQHAF